MKMKNITYFAVDFICIVGLIVTLLGKAQVNDVMDESEIIRNAI